MQQNLAARQRDVDASWAVMEGPIELALRSMADEPIPPIQELPRVFHPRPEEEQLPTGVLSSLFLQARALHGRFCEKRELAVRRIKNLTEIERRIFEVSAELTKQEDESRLSGELAQLTEYERTIKEFLSEINPIAPGSLMGRLKSIVDRMHYSILGHKREEEKIVEAVHNQNDDEEIAELDRKIESQEAEIKEVEMKLVEAQKEYFRRQELVAMQYGRREVQGNNQPLSETGRMLRKLMCPVCRKRERNCVLRHCGHAVCRNCLEGKLCPVCRRPFVKADVIGLTFGK
jgi:hypothetical protein